MKRLALTTRALGALLLGACSANPLDADKEGCIEVAGVGNTCENGTGTENGNGGATQTQEKTCQEACSNLAACLDLSQTGLRDEAGCVDACGTDPQGSTCLADAGDDCTAVQACLSGGGAGDPAVCAPACANLAACVDLSQTELRDESTCVDVCERDPQGSTCLSNAGRDCTAVLACIPGANGGGGMGACAGACANLDACYDLSQTAYGSEAGCVTACNADSTGSDCVAAARDCAAVEVCLSGGGGGGGGSTCARACQRIDQCSDGGLAGQGLTQAQCETACGAGQLAASVAQCLAGAQDCNTANGCVK